MPRSRQRFSKPSAVKRLPRSVGRRVTRKGKAATASSRKASAAAAVSSRDRLLQEGLGGGRGLLVLDREVDRARAPVDGHEQEALAALAVGGPQLGQVLHVHVDEAELVLLELARGRLGLGRGRPAAQAR